MNDKKEQVLNFLVLSVCVGVRTSNFLQDFDPFGLFVSDRFGRVTEVSAIREGIVVHG